LAEKMKATKAVEVVVKTPAKAKVVSGKKMPAKKKPKKEVATKTDLKKLRGKEVSLNKKISLLSKQLKKTTDALNKVKVNQLQDIKGIKAFVNDKVAQITAFNKIISANEAKINELKNKIVRLESQLSNFANNVSVTDEEIAQRLVKLYFEEIARLGFKRSLDLDSIINAYYYTLERIKRKNIELSLVAREVVKAERVNEIEKSIESTKELVQSTPEKLPTKEPYSYTNSKGQKYFLHQRGKLFYFSKDPDNAISLPAGMKVIESEKTGLPILRKK